MRKVMIWLLIVIFATSMALIGIGCKEKAAPSTEEAVPTEEEVTEEEPAEEEAVAEAEKVWKIGFNNYADTHEFCYKVHDGIEEAAEEYGVELLYTEALMDGARMIANTQTLIDQGADLIIDFNWIPEVGATMLEMCNEAGVKLISMDTVYEGTYYFGVDSYNAGQVLAEYAAEVIREKWDGQIDACVGLYYVGGGDIVMDRVTGFEDYLKDAEGIQFPDPEMVFIFDAGGAEQTIPSERTITDFLTAHPDLEHIVIITHNDETATGVFAGIEGSGRQEDCILASHGGDTPFHEHIRGGGGDVWIASVTYAPETYGSQVIPMAIDILEGKDVPMVVNLNHFVLNENNLDEYYPQ